MPSATMFLRKWSKAPRSRSTKTTLRAPRERHSSPSEPVPANASRTLAPSIRSPSVSKSDCLARSVIGRVVSVSGGRIFLPPNSPAMMRIDCSESENCPEGHRTTICRESTCRRCCFSSVEPRTLSLRWITTQDQAGRLYDNAGGLRCPAIPWQLDDGRIRGGILVLVQSRISPVTRLNLPERAPESERLGRAPGGGNRVLGDFGNEEGDVSIPRRNVFAVAMLVAFSLFCWQATQGAKPKDEMLELYGLFVDAVEKVEANYVRPVSRRELLE